MHETNGLELTMIFTLSRLPMRCAGYMPHMLTDSIEGNQSGIGRAVSSRCKQLVRNVISAAAE
jgi:hypothetical protein